MKTPLIKKLWKGAHLFALAVTFSGCGGDAVTVPYGSSLVLSEETISDTIAGCPPGGYRDHFPQITAVDSVGDPLNQVELFIHYPNLSVGTVEFLGVSAANQTVTPLTPYPRTDPSGIYQLGLRVWCGAAHGDTLAIKSASATASIVITVN